MAHNDETNQYRGLRGEKLTAVMDALRAGCSVEEAAVTAGCTRRSITMRARRDVELAGLLATEGRGGGLDAVRGDQAAYLAALLTSGGDRRAATVACGVASTRVDNWRRDPRFEEAEAAVQSLAAQKRVVPGRRLPSLEEQKTFLDALGRTGSPARAADAAGLPLRRFQSLRRTDESFRAQWYNRVDPPAEYRDQDRHGLDSAFDDDLLRELWGDEGLSVAEIAAVLEARPEATQMRAIQLGLPGRPA